MTKTSISWTRLLAEGTAIVLSILVAFSIEAWWDGLQEKKHLSEVLTRLESGLLESLSLIDRNLELSVLDGVRLRRLLAPQLSRQGQIASDSTYVFLQALWRPNTYDNNVALIRSLLDDESVKLLNDPAFQEEAVRWREEAEDVEERGRQLVVAERDALHALGRHEGVAWVLLGVADEVSAAMLSALIEDPEIRAIGARKEAHARVQRLRLRLLRERSAALLERVQSMRSQ